MLNEKDSNLNENFVFVLGIKEGESFFICVEKKINNFVNHEFNFFKLTFNP